MTSTEHMKRGLVGHIPVEARLTIDLMFLVVLAVALGGWWLKENAFLRKYSSETLRIQWTSDGTLARLKTWASEIISGKRLPGRDWPTVSGPAFVGYANFLRDGEGRVIAVAFEMGGADNHHGLLIGQRPPEFYPLQTQWEEGVWWYDEVPRIDERSNRKLKRN